MAPTLLLLLLLLWPQGCTSGVPAESVYSKVQHFEGETLSVQCSYKSRKKHVEGKVWCKIRKKKCEPGFTRIWAQGPRYLLQDDAQAKVVNITMVALRRQDSGRYWCMRNSSGTLYPLMGFQLEVSPVPTAERNTPLTQLANILKSGIVITTGRDPTSGPGAPFPSSVRMFTPGVLTLARLLPSTASGTIRLSSMTGYSFTSPSTPGPRGTERLQTVTATPSHARASSAGPASVSTKAGQLGTGSPTTRLCHTNRSLLNKLSPIRRQDSNLTVLAGVLTFLSVPVMMMAGYGFWKKRHRGSYSMCRDPSRPWRDPPGRPKPPWKPTWFKATYAVGELFAETPRGHTRSEDGDLSGLEPGWGGLLFPWEARSHCDTAKTTQSPPQPGGLPGKAEEYGQHLSLEEGCPPDWSEWRKHLGLDVASLLLQGPPGWGGKCHSQETDTARASVGATPRWIWGEKRRGG